MGDQTWAFSRGTDNLEISRRQDAGGIVLGIKSTGRPKAYRFSDATALERFQQDMERMLLGTGWSFVGFSPERRAGRDRRGWPRLTERRRWWTDGVRWPARSGGEPSPAPHSPSL